MLVSGYWILKGNHPHFIQDQASSIQHLAAYCANVSFKDLLGPSDLGWLKSVNVSPGAHDTQGIEFFL